MPPVHHQVLVGQQRADACVFQSRVHVLFQAPHLAPARRVGPQEPIVQPQRAQWQAPRPQQTPPPEVDQLQAAAAHVQHDAVLDRQAVHRAVKPVARFLGAIGNVDGDPELLADTSRNRRRCSLRGPPRSPRPPSAERPALVATATKPRTMRSVRSIVSALSRPPLATSRTRRKGLRASPSTSRCAAPRTRATMTRPLFEPISITPRVCPATAVSRAHTVDHAPAGGWTRRLLLEDIPDPAHGLDAPRQRGIRLNLAAQPADVHVHGAGVADIFVAPDVAE